VLLKILSFHVSVIRGSEKKYLASISSDSVMKTGGK
jgi:hypothetical protein